MVAVCTLIHRAAPDLVTLAWEVGKRAGKVYLDANMNRAGASLSAPYSLRARWGAPVSMPFSWDDLDDVDPAAYTLATVPSAMSGRADGFAPVARDGGASLADAIRSFGLQGRS